MSVSTAVLQYCSGICVVIVFLLLFYYCLCYCSNLIFDAIRGPSVSGICIVIVLFFDVVVNVLLLYFHY